MPDDLDSAHTEFETSIAAIARAQNDLLGASTTVESKNRELSVTVDGRGDVTAIKFRTRAYRAMSPTELGTLLVDTIGAARRESLGRATAAFAPVLPAGLPLQDMLAGPVDLDRMMGDAVTAMMRGRGRP